MADQWVRLGMAVALIAFVSVSLYAFGTRAHGVEPGFIGLIYRH